MVIAFLSTYRRTAERSQRIRRQSAGDSTLLAEGYMGCRVAAGLELLTLRLCGDSQPTIQKLATPVFALRSLGRLRIHFAVELS